ncbi:max dimerization protein 1-like isoform X2 [Macrosteles quadrilineatus]|uniref:max dimerization protein 1-like isoform X2 n=1 Tax=Macrosteles quadrilineatus TaxID=74068 RepID=UPI0023E0C08E|nr:max dimerization protein 1-like isoform X2 [Macrosteles quadrilineatus]
MSIAALLQAAEYLERREREAEHGYASTLPPDDLRSFSKRPKTKKTQGNRRAHLRNCLEKLKEMVPLGHEASRHTTLGLLTKAKRFIKNLENQERKHAIQKEHLSREQRYLRRRLEQLGSLYTKRRSVSECSISTVSSTNSSRSSSSVPVSAPSPSSISESDEVDIIGYTSNQSDTDDHSTSSDSGVAMSTSRLTLSEMEIV